MSKNLSFLAWLKIDEMSLRGRGVQYHSDDPGDYPHGASLGDTAFPFVARDRRLMGDPGYWPSLEKSLEVPPKGWGEEAVEGESFSKGGFDWNIYMIENPSGGRSFMSKRQYVDHVRKVLEDRGVVLDNHITIVKNRSTGEPMTKWMTIHTAAHAILDVESSFDDAGGEVKRRNNAIMSSVKGLLYDLAGEFYGDKSQPLDDNKVLNVVSRYFPHKSGEGFHAWKLTGRPDHLSRFGSHTLEELVFDLLTQYIVTKDVRLTEETPFAKVYLPGGKAKLPQGGMDVEVEFDPLEPSELGEERLRDYSGRLRRLLLQSLYNAVGHMVFHYRPPATQATKPGREIKKSLRSRQTAQ